MKVGGGVGKNRRGRNWKQEEIVHKVTESYRKVRISRR